MMRMQDQVPAFFLAFLATTMATNQHLICKSVNEVFSDGVGGNYGVRNDTQQRNVVQGKPGKRGAVGPRGFLGSRGLKGDAGNVDYNNISNIVERKVCQGLGTIASGITELRKDVANIQQHLEELKCGISNLRYNGTCYSTPYLSASRDLSYGSADLACRKQGSKLAEIHDRTQQQTLEDFIRRKIPSSLTEIHFWIGMNIDGNVLRYESGKEVALNHLVWWPGHPKSESYRRLMILGVKKSGGDGLWSYKEWNAEGVICERII